MKFHISLSLLVSIFFFLFVSLTLVDMVQDYKSCQKNYTCGGLSVGYPFWGADRPALCGPPGFNLSCQKDNDSSGKKFSVINMNGNRFRVIEINKSTSRLRIARLDLWKIPCSNDGILRSTSLDFNSFSFLENANKNLTLIYNCLQLSDAGSCNCSVNGVIVSSIYYYNGNSSLGDCSNNSIRVPILNTNMEKLGSTNLQDSINGGFDVEYAYIGKLCQACESHDGICARSGGSFVCVKHTGWKGLMKILIGIAAAIIFGILLIWAVVYLIRRKEECLDCDWD